MLLCLDFDGVLHPLFEDASCPEGRRFSSLPRLESWLRRHPDADVLVTSSWRRTRTLDDLRVLFAPDLRGRVVGATPCIGSGNGPGARQDEVEAWLQKQGRVELAWVALDDMPELYRPGSAVVATHDRFHDREEEMLETAWSDPAAWSRLHPVVHTPPGGLWLPPSVRPRTPGC